MSKRMPTQPTMSAPEPPLSPFAQTSPFAQSLSVPCVELRDYFAAAALTVLLSDQSMVWESKNLASRAYDIADEMLRVRGCSNPVKG